MTADGLITVSALRRELHAATTPTKVLTVAQRAARAKKVFEAIGRSIEECNEFAEIYLSAYWKFGDLVDGTPRGRRAKQMAIDNHLPGTVMQRKYARTLRNGIEETDIPDYVQAATEKLEPASIAGCLEWIAPPVQPAVRRAAVWPDGKYGLILADPPWQPDAGLLDPSRRIENQYPTMALEALVALRPQIDTLAHEDCVLVMWTTTQKLSEAATLVDAWGFTVKSGAVWVKNSIGMGYWFRGRHELVILAVRGTPMTPLEADRPDSVIVANRRGHSEKPDEIYTLLERMFPTLPKVEIFARASRAGWAHGPNETTLRSA